MVNKIDVNKILDLMHYPNNPNGIPKTIEELQYFVNICINSIHPEVNKLFEMCPKCGETKYTICGHQCLCDMLEYGNISKENYDEAMLVKEKEQPQEKQGGRASKDTANCKYQYCGWCRHPLRSEEIQEECDHYYHERECLEYEEKQSKEK